MKLLVLFIICNILNVIIQTVKSIVTVKGGKTAAALVNAIAYGFYTYIIVLTVCDLPMLAKCLIVGSCNLIGVYAVKYFEQKMQKDKLWKIECTVPNAYTENLHIELNNFNISHNFIPDGGKWAIFNIYCPTKKESEFVHNLLDRYKAKYFISESKSF